MAQQVGHAVRRALGLGLDLARDAGRPLEKGGAVLGEERQLEVMFAEGAAVEDEAAGKTVTGPGLPPGLAPKDRRWFSTDCIEPPPLEG